MTECYCLIHLLLTFSLITILVSFHMVRYQTRGLIKNVPITACSSCWSTVKHCTGGKYVGGASSTTTSTSTEAPDLDASVASFFLPVTLDGDMRTAQSYIAQHQFPASCSSAAVMSQGHWDGTCGIGCDVHVMLHYMQATLVKGGTSVLFSSFLFIFMTRFLAYFTIIYFGKQIRPGWPPHLHRYVRLPG